MTSPPLNLLHTVYLCIHHIHMHNMQCIYTHVCVLSVTWLSEFFQTPLHIYISLLTPCSYTIQIPVSLLSVCISQSSPEYSIESDNWLLHGQLLADVTCVCENKLHPCQDRQPIAKRTKLPLVHQYAGGVQLASPSETTLPFTITTIFSQNGMKERGKKPTSYLYQRREKSFLIRLGMMG